MLPTFKNSMWGLLSGDLAVPSLNVSPADQRGRFTDDELARQQSHLIDEQIEKQHAEMLRVQKTQRKVLLIGQVASDKTALLKQLLLRQPRTQFDSDRAHIYLNVINSVQHILNAVAIPNNNITFNSPRPWPHQTTPNQDYPPHIAALATRLQPLLDIQNPLERYLQRSANVSTPYFPLQTWGFTQNITMDWSSKDDPGQLFVSCADVLVALWDDPTVQDALAKQQPPIQDLLPFFMDDLARITSRGYLPSLNDILQLQRRPWGVQEYYFRFKHSSSLGSEWRIFDVGDAEIQSQSPRWASYFQDVNTIVFLAPVGMFDQTVSGHPAVNYLKYTILLWKEICSNPLLHNVAIILFMCKCDMLKAKLESGVQFCKYMEVYEGPNESRAVIDYIRRTFDRLRAGARQQEMYSSAVSDIDSRVVDTIISAVYDQFLKDRIKALNIF